MTSNMGVSGTTIQFKIPLRELIGDFSFNVNAMTSGNGSYSYENIGYRNTSLVKLIVLINGESYPELDQILPQDIAKQVGPTLAASLKMIIPQSQVKTNIQVCINTGKNCVASETISAFSKNVLAGCSGGDRSRKDKLLNQQKKGKDKMANNARKVQLNHHQIIQLFTKNQ